MKEKDTLPTETTLTGDEGMLLKEIADHGSITTALEKMQIGFINEWKSGEDFEPEITELLPAAAKKKTKQIAASLADKLRILARGLK